MKQIVKVANLVLDKITDALTLLSGVCIAATALIIFYEVVMRSFFNAPTEWSLEMSVYLVLAAGFLGFAATQRDNKNIQVDILITRLSPRTNLYLGVFANVVVLAFSLVLLVESLDMTMTSFELNRTSPSTLRVPLWMPQATLPLGAALLVLQVVCRLVRDLAGLASGKEGSDRA